MSRYIALVIFLIISSTANPVTLKELADGWVDLYSFKHYAIWAEQYTTQPQGLITEWYYENGWILRPFTTEKEVVIVKKYEGGVLVRWTETTAETKIYGESPYVYAFQQYYVPEVPPDPNGIIRDTGRLLEDKIESDPDNPLWQGLLKLIQEKR